MTVNVRSSPVTQGNGLASPTAVPFGFTAEAGRLLVLTCTTSTDLQSQSFTAPSGWSTAYNNLINAGGYVSGDAVFYRVSDGTETTVSAVHQGNGGLIFRVHEIEVEKYAFVGFTGSAVDSTPGDVSGVTNNTQVTTTAARSFCFASSYAEAVTPNPPPYATLAGERWILLDRLKQETPFQFNDNQAYFEAEGTAVDVNADWTYDAFHYTAVGLAVFELEPIEEPDMLGLFNGALGTVKNTFKIAGANLLATALTASRSFTLPDKSGTLALTDDVVTMQKSILSATQANSTTSPTVLTGCTFTLLPGQTLQLNATLVFTAAATTTGAALGVRVAQGSGADANARGSAFALVNVANAAGAGGLSDGDQFNVAANTNSLFETVGTASTSGNNGAMIRAVVHNASTNANTTVTVEFRSEVGGSAVTAQIGSGATAIIG